MTSRKRASPAYVNGQMPRISLVAWVTLTCFSVATIALLWAGWLLVVAALNST